mgnify:FL=1
MSAGPVRRSALDRSCALACALVVVLRCVEFAFIETGAFSAAVGNLPKLFFVVTSSNLAVFALVPLTIMLGISNLQTSSSPQILIRAGSGAASTAMCSKISMVRSAVFSLTVVASGLFLISAKGFWVFGAAAAISFLIAETVLIMLFCACCQLVMLFIWSLSASLPTAICSAALYGSLDYLASFSPALDHPALYLGWRLTLLEATMPVSVMVCNGLRLLTIALILAFASARVASRRDLLPAGGGADVL